MPVLGGQTIAQVFADKKLWAWFDDGVTNRYNGSTEKGQDYSTSHGTPVCAPVGGTIVRIVHNNNSIGDVVELRDSSGAVWLYQHIVAKVRVGSNLLCGSIVGTEDGLPIDQYSTGPHIEVRYCPPGKWSANTDSWNEPWVNPAAIFAGVGKLPAGAVATNPLSSFISGASDSKVPVSLAPNADVSALLRALDLVFVLTDPFKFDISGMQDSVAGVQFTDPVAWTAQVAQNLVDDSAALVLRMIFLALGFFVIYKVLSVFIDFGAVSQTIASGAETLGRAAVMFA